jgi:RNA polymerase sigma-70 factor (sigma-E family)
VRSQRSDDATGFAAFVHTRQAALVRLGWALTGDRQAGEDLAQMALDRLWSHWPRVSSTGEPWAYAQRVAINLAATRRRRRRHRAEVLTASVPDQRACPDESDGTDLRQTIEGWLHRLPAGQRAVVTLRFIFDLSIQETANILQCSPGTVKSQTAKALAHLRAIAISTEIMR